MNKKNFYFTDDFLSSSGLNVGEEANGSTCDSLLWLLLINDIKEPFFSSSLKIEIEALFFSASSISNLLNNLSSASFKNLNFGGGEDLNLLTSASDNDSKRGLNQWS